MRGTGVDFRWGYIVRSSPDVDLREGGNRRGCEGGDVSERERVYKWVHD